MSKIVYELVQLFEVENGVPRLLNSRIQVISGGEDLLSLAMNKLAEAEFDQKFQTNQTSQYIGYRLKNAPKGNKRYQLLLSQRKEDLCISIPRDIVQDYLFRTLSTIAIQAGTQKYDPEQDDPEEKVSRDYWVIPSQEDIFYEIHKRLKFYRKSPIEPIGDFDLDPITNPEFITPEDPRIPVPSYSVSKDAETIYVNPWPYFSDLERSGCCIRAWVNTLFPYCFQFSIDSRENLDEFLDHFIPVILESIA